MTTLRKSKLLIMDQVKLIKHFIFFFIFFCGILYINFLYCNTCFPCNIQIYSGIAIEVYKTLFFLVRTNKLSYLIR